VIAGTPTLTGHLVEWRPELSARYRTLALEYKMLAAADDSVWSGAAGIGNVSSVADEREAD
jgi:hypothetical protein